MLKQHLFSCSLEGNPRLFPSSGSPEQTHKKTLLVPIVASVGSVSILIAALVLYLVLRKKKQPTVEGNFQRYAKSIKSHETVFNLTATF